MYTLCLTSIIMYFDIKNFFYKEMRHYNSKEYNVKLCEKRVLQWLQQGAYSMLRVHNYYLIQQPPHEAWGKFPVLIVKHSINYSLIQFYWQNYANWNTKTVIIIQYEHACHMESGN